MDLGPDASAPSRFYAFRPFLLDTLKRVLYRDGQAVHLTPRALDTLLILIRHRDRVVEKDEILRDVWRGVIVEENTLARHVSTLRHALGEGPHDHRYVVTIPGRGYRFVAEVEEKEEEEKEEGAPIGAQRPEPPVAAAIPRPWLVRGLAAAAVVTVLGGAYYAYAFRSPREDPARAIWQLTFDAGLQGEPSWSPDGRMVAYSSDRAGDLDIWVQATAGGDPIRVTEQPGHQWQPNWSPDGRLIVYRSEEAGGGLFVSPSLGGEPRQVASFGHYPRWSPDGRTILFDRSNLKASATGGRQIYTVGLDGHAPTEVLGAFLDQFRAVETNWYPDGRRVSLWGVHRELGLTFWTASLRGQGAVRSAMDHSVAATFTDRALTFANADDVPTRFSWSPRGDALYFEGFTRGVRNLWKVGVDPRTLGWTSGPERLTTGPELNADLGLHTAGGKLAFVVRDERVRLWSFPFDANSGMAPGPGTPITASTFDALAPDLSPDGKRLVFKAEYGGKQELRERSFETGAETRLVRGDIKGRWVPRWANDSRHVSYAREERTGAQRDIVVLNASGGDTEREQVLPSLTGVFDLAFDWSADGSWVVGGARHRNGLYELAIAATNPGPSSAGDIRPLASDPARNLWQARLSPNQQWVAFSAARRHQSSLSVVPTAGGMRRTITDGLFFDDRPQWSPDGRTIYFLSNRSGFFNVWGQRFDPEVGLPIGTPFQVTAFNTPSRMIPDRLRQLGLAIGGGRLVLPISEMSGNIWVLDGLDP